MFDVNLEIIMKVAGDLMHAMVLMLTQRVVCLALLNAKKKKKQTTTKTMILNLVDRNGKVHTYTVMVAAKKQLETVK